MPTDAPTPEERESRSLPGRLDVPATGFLDPGDDPKGWDRASIKLNTHPVHPMPRVTQADLVLPSGDRLKLFGDSALFGACVAGLCYFPLFIANVLIKADLTRWLWWALLGIGVAAGTLLFTYAWATERKFREFVASL
jgi:hypothetical protein